MRCVVVAAVVCLLAVAALQVVAAEETAPSPQSSVGTPCNDGAAVPAPVAEAADPEAVHITILRWVGIFVLVCCSGLFSGLTLGLLGLDVLGLQLVIDGTEDPNDRRYAREIMKLRKNGNLLLCTLLLGNVLVNSALSIVSASIFSGPVALIASSFVIVVFGEIIPQATCSRHALYIGYKTIDLVIVFKFLLYPITWPIAKILDKVLGEEVGTIHSRSEMEALFKAYAKKGKLDEEEADIMVGAVTYKDKVASDVMTPADKMFCVSMTDKLDFNTLSLIFKSGFSRIPIVESAIDRHVVGMILTKDLIMIDPEEAHSVSAAMQLFGRDVHEVWPDTKLPDILKLFKSGKGHLAVVMETNNTREDIDPFKYIVGLVTLEDIIEEILQAEIVDETDVYVHMEVGDRVSRDSFDFGRLRLLDSTITDSGLSVDELRAVAAHLVANVSAFGSNVFKGSDALEQVKELLRRATVEQVTPGSHGPRVLYRRNKSDVHFTLILSGRVEILSGRDQVRVEYGAFQHLGEACLTVAKGAWKPDFTATIVEESRLVRVPVSLYIDVVAGRKRRSGSGSNVRERGSSADKEEDQISNANDSSQSHEGGNSAV
eukprot:g144.t1